MRPSASITRPVPQGTPEQHEQQPMHDPYAGSYLATRLLLAEGHAVVAVRGEIDPLTADLFGQQLDAAFAQVPRIVVDLREVTFMDSSGVRVLVQSFRDRDLDPTALVLRAPSPFIQRLLSITGLDKIFTIETDAPSPNGAMA